jgi:hypothetical protein
MHPADPDPTPGLTPFFNDEKKGLFFYIFSYNSPTGTLSELLKI